MSGVVLSIDPGQAGAFAWVSGEGYLIEVLDMPVIEVRGKRRVCAAEVAKLMKRRDVDCVVIEETGTRPGESPVAAHSFGKGAGILEGAAAALCLPIHMVRPTVWKRTARVPADKGAACEMAINFWPGAADTFKGPKGGLKDGRADASLLGRWAAMGGVL